MPWEDFLLSTRPSSKVKRYQNQEPFSGKYIGIVPILWDPLAIYKNSKSLEDKLEQLSIESDSEIKVIETNKDIFLVNSIFYFLENQKERFYPVYKYDEHLPFTHSNLKDQFAIWLKDLGYLEPHFKYFRIYKMKGFHLFVLLLDKGITKLKKGWKGHSGLPLLRLEDNEIVNSMIKVSQSHYQQKERYKGYSSSLSKNSWDNPLEGYVVDEDQVFPFKITFEKVIATLSNIIDSKPQENFDLYFQVKLRKRKRNGGDLFLELQDKNKKKKFKAS